MRVARRDKCQRRKSYGLLSAAEFGNHDKAEISCRIAAMRQSHLRNIVHYLSRQRPIWKRRTVVEVLQLGFTSWGLRVVAASLMADEILSGPSCELEVLAVGSEAWLGQAISCCLQSPAEVRTTSSTSAGAGSHTTGLNEA